MPIDVYIAALKTDHSKKSRLFGDVSLNEVELLNRLISIGIKLTRPQNFNPVWMWSMSWASVLIEEENSSGTLIELPRSPDMKFNLDTHHGAVAGFETPVNADKTEGVKVE